MKTFIRVVEVWVPDRDHTLLEFGGGLYGGATRFAAISRSICFGRGEGLPGRAWEERRPIVLKQFEGSYFRRTEAARTEGLTCGIALPVFAGNELRAVLLIFCGDDAEHAGAIELWRNQPAESPDMRLDDGYYGTTAEVFEFLSRHTAFRQGIGLPGLAWAAGRPVFLADLRKGGKFLRADSAVKVGINRGFAIPCSTPGPDVYVMAFLSALATPLVRRFETWLPDGSARHLTRSEGFCEQQGVLADEPLLRVELGEGPLGRAFRSGVPTITEKIAAEASGPLAQASTAGLQSVVALPVLQQGQVVAVVAWYF
ncbi:MAG: GAF domain-containing protein [Piscinibacter sp.]|nr:GAF domain-containing protein [Piscinibacter sp.]